MSHPGVEEDSPCIGVCQIDAFGYCVGCGRTAHEIFGDDPPPAEDEEPPASTPPGHADGAGDRDL